MRPVSHLRTTHDDCASAPRTREIWFADVGGQGRCSTTGDGLNFLSLVWTVSDDQLSSCRSFVRLGTVAQGATQRRGEKIRQVSVTGREMVRLELRRFWMRAPAAKWVVAAAHWTRKRRETKWEVRKIFWNSLGTNSHRSRYLSSNSPGNTGVRTYYNFFRWKHLNMTDKWHFCWNFLILSIIYMEVPFNQLRNDKSHLLMWCFLDGGMGTTCIISSSTRFAKVLLHFMEKSFRSLR